MSSDLITSMSMDMGIRKFHNETQESFIYRLCYSALGQWCLRIARNRSDGVVGSTKHTQTLILGSLLTRFSDIFPHLSGRFMAVNHQQKSLSVFMRRVYEETGYLLTDNKNRNRLANFGRAIQMGTRSLFFGIPSTLYTVTGLGVYANSFGYSVPAKEFLIRDSLTCEEYLRGRYDPVDFYGKDVDTRELQFFDPHLNKAPSQSWVTRPKTGCTVARKAETGPFYRVLEVSGTYQFADEPVKEQDDTLTSYEYRRLYFALKSHYGTPVKAMVTKFDDFYSKMRIGGHLPNREYYFMLLMSWPENNAFDKSSFILANDLLPSAIDALTSIGIDVREE